MDFINVMCVLLTQKLLQQYYEMYEEEQLLFTNERKTVTLLYINLSHVSDIYKHAL